MWHIAVKFIPFSSSHFPSHPSILPSPPKKSESLSCLLVLFCSCFCDDGVVKSVAWMWSYRGQAFSPPYALSLVALGEMRPHEAFSTDDWMFWYPVSCRPYISNCSYHENIIVMAMSWIEDRISQFSSPFSITFVFVWPFLILFQFI